MSADVRVELPEGWEQLPNPNGPVTYSPDEGESVLQISSPSWGWKLRGSEDLVEYAALLEDMVQGGKLGRVIASAPVTLPYGRALRAEVDSDEHEDVAAWLTVPDSHDVLLVTWIAGAAAYGETASEVVATLRPGLFSSALASAVDVATRALASNELGPHAVFFGDGTITTVPLEVLPQQIWTDACRVEAARAKADVVVQVLAATSNGQDVAVIYGESKQHKRKLLVRRGQRPVELDPAEPRVDFFAAPDPRVVAILDAARR